MMQIRTISKTLFTSMEVQGLGDSLVKALEENAQGGQVVIEALLNTLKSSLITLSQSRGNSVHNTHTDILEEADLVRDNAFRAFWMMIDAGSLRQQETYRNAAVRIQSYLSPFDRTLHSFGYSKQSTALKDFIAVLEKEEVAQALRTMQMQDWLEELKEAQEKFLEVYESKIEEESLKQALIPAKDAREQVLVHIIALCHTLNGLMLSGQKDLIDISTKIDQIIEDYEVKARARRSRKK